jgi:hypothetical protein
VVEQLGKGPSTRAINLPSWDDCAAHLLRVYESVKQ